MRIRCSGHRNKHIIINAFSGDVIVQNVPADIPFGIYFVLEDVDIQRMDMELSLNGQSVFKGHAGPVVGTGPIVIPMFQIKVTNAENIMELVPTADGYKPTTAIRKKNYVGEVSPP